MKIINDLHLTKKIQTNVPESFYKTRKCRKSLECIEILLITMSFAVAPCINSSNRFRDVSIDSKRLP